MKKLCPEDKQAGRACLVAAHEEGAGLLAVLLDTEIRGVTPSACQQSGAHITLHTDGKVSQQVCHVQTSFAQVELASFIASQLALKEFTPQSLAKVMHRLLAKRRSSFAWVP